MWNYCNISLLAPFVVLVGDNLYRALLPRGLMHVFDLVGQAPPELYRKELLLLASRHLALVLQSLVGPVPVCATYTRERGITETDPTARL